MSQWRAVMHGRVRRALVLGAGLVGAFLVGSALAEPARIPPLPAPIHVVQLSPQCVVAGGDVKLQVSRVEPGSDVTLQGDGVTSNGEPLDGVSGAASKSGRIVFTMAIRRDVPRHALVAAELLTGGATDTRGTDAPVAGAYLVGTRAACAEIAKLTAHAHHRRLEGTRSQHRAGARG